MEKKTTPTPESAETATPNSDVLHQTLLTGFVFNMNLLMQQMVANQHALQQILTASTAKAVAEITNPSNTNDAVVLKNVDVVLKAIQESSSSYIQLIRQLAVEADHAIKIIKN
jgi:hypothetical protein